MLTTRPRTRAATADRRMAPRQGTHRPVKLRADSRIVRYVAGRTCNLSAGGALIELDRAADLHTGDTIRLAIADCDNAPLLTADRMVEATILRRDPAHIAVRFAQPQKV